MIKLRVTYIELYIGWATNTPPRRGSIILVGGVLDLYSGLGGLYLPAHNGIEYLNDALRKLTVFTTSVDTDH